METTLARCVADIATTPYLFVYGTLRKDGGANSVLGDSEFVGIARLPDYSMVSDGIPFTFPDPEGRGVVGEVWRVDSAARLCRIDRYEGGCYHRPLVEPYLDCRRAVKAWAYIALPSIAKDFTSRAHWLGRSPVKIEDYILDRRARRW